MVRWLVCAGMLTALTVAGSGCAPDATAANEQAQRDLEAQWLRQARLDAAGFHTATQPTETWPPAPTAVGTLDDCLAYAVVHNPSLEAAFDRWRAALERIPQASALPDPQFTYRYYVRAVMMRDGDMRNMFEVAQTFPWLPKLTLRADVAGQEAAAAYQRFQAARLKVVYKVKEAYYECAYLGRQIAVLEENVRLLDYLESAIAARYRVAAGGHADLIRAQVEQGKLGNELASTRDMLGPTRARLNAALNRPADAPAPSSTTLPEAALDAPDAVLAAWMEQDNPDLKAMDFDATGARRSVELARQEYYPDLMAGVEYQAMVKSVPGMTPEDPIALMFSVNIPIWWAKYDAGVREARARHRAAVKDRGDLGNSLAVDLKMATYRFRDAQRRVRLYRDTLQPKAREHFKATEAAFRSGAMTFLEVIDSQRTMLEFQLEQERALADAAQRLAEIEMIVGRPLRPDRAEKPASQPASRPTGP